MRTRQGVRWSGLVGVVSAMATLAIAEFVALIVAPASSPLLAVGSFVIDIAPGWLKNLTIALFGTNDKLVLLLCLALLVAILAVAIGILEFLRPPWGVVGLVTVAGIATAAVTTRAGATWVWALPTVLGMVAGVAVLRLAIGRLRTWVDATHARTHPLLEAERGLASRRQFLAVVGSTAAAAAVVGIGARLANAGTVAVNAVRSALRLPTPAIPAPPIPASADLGIHGVAPLVTPNEFFYRIDTALQVPRIDAETWRLKITGMVENEVELTFDELLALPLKETVITLACVSNEVGGYLVGNATWLGYPVRDLLARAKPRPGADMVLSSSSDGFTAGTPLSVLLEEDRDSILAVGMNGAPLPLEHGFPVRMVVPGLYGYVSATKWLVELKLTTFAADSAFWTDRGWDAMGPVKTSSRIDVPRNGTQVDAGTVAIAGVAWAQHTGIERVEVRIDGDEWLEARLATAISDDTWVQWVYEWKATSGDHMIQVRATDATGMTQSGERVRVDPNGAEGWHTVSVSVA